MSSLANGPDMAPPALYRLPEACALLRLSRSVIYEQIRTGRLRTVRQGTARRVPSSAITEYVALLEREAGENRSDETSKPGRRRALLG